MRVSDDLLVCSSFPESTVSLTSKKRCSLIVPATASAVVMSAVVTAAATALGVTPVFTAAAAATAATAERDTNGDRDGGETAAQPSVDHVRAARGCLRARGEGAECCANTSKHAASVVVCSQGLFLVL
jgi:hypothetical protein